MTDLERLELALHRTKHIFKEGTDTRMFIEILIREVSRQNNHAYALSQPEVKE